MDVIDLMRQHLDYNRRKQRQAAKTTGPGSTANEVIRRPAGDDWF